MWQQGRVKSPAFLFEPAVNLFVSLFQAQIVPAKSARLAVLTCGDPAGPLKRRCARFLPFLFSAGSSLFRSRFGPGPGLPIGPAGSGARGLACCAAP